MTVSHSLIGIENNNIASVNGKRGGGVSELNKYFGRKPGQSLTDFGAELKELTLNDKVQLVGGIVDGTFNY